MKIAIKKKITEEKWVDDVKTKWTPPEGTFAKETPSEKTAEIVCKGHKGDLKKAVDSVNFFFNRCGEKCAGWGEKKRKEIIDILNKKCKSNESLINEDGTVCDLFEIIGNIIYYLLKNKIPTKKIADIIKQVYYDSFGTNFSPDFYFEKIFKLISAKKELNNYKKELLEIGEYI